MNTQIHTAEIQQEAEQLFADGFLCSEAVVAAIRKHLDLDIPETIIAAASGFAGGIGGAKCLCGAVSGGVLALGLVFGRTVPKDSKIQKCLAVTNELQASFKQANGKNSLCCRVLTKEFDRTEASMADQAKQCMHFTGLVAKKTAEIIVRECGLTDEAARAATASSPC